jgi:hypothetical protein
MSHTIIYTFYTFSAAEGGKRELGDTCQDLALVLGRDVNLICLYCAFPDAAHF